jgi:hypothetical protein
MLNCTPPSAAIPGLYQGICLGRGSILLSPSVLKRPMEKLILAFCSNYALMTTGIIKKIRINPFLFIGLRIN